MSQHSAASTTSTNQTPTTTTTNVTTTTTTTLKEESSSATKPCSSSTGSLKKQKNKDKDAEIPITDDFVLMSTPDKFKDKNINDSNVVVKRLCTESSATSSAITTSTATNEKVNLECLLLSDLTTNEFDGVPVHVQTLLKHFNNSQLRQTEILLLLVYVIALESGYVEASHYDQVQYEIQHLSATATFHAKNILHLSHYKPNFNASEDKTRFSLKLHTLIDVEPVEKDYLYALLTAMVTGDFLIVTLTPSPSKGAKGFSLALSIGRYVLSMQSKQKPLFQRFRKMPELSLILRDQLFIPMRCQQLVWLDCSIYPSLTGLPTELYDHILKYLSKNQLNILANVNKSLYNLCKISKFNLALKGSLTKNIL